MFDFQSTHQGPAQTLEYSLLTANTLMCTCKSLNFCFYFTTILFNGKNVGIWLISFYSLLSINNKKTLIKSKSHTVASEIIGLWPPNLTDNPYQPVQNAKRQEDRVRDKFCAAACHILYGTSAYSLTLQRTRVYLLFFVLNCSTYIL